MTEIVAHHLREAEYWARRSLACFAKVGHGKLKLHCRLSRLAIAQHAEKLANREAALAMLAAPKTESLGMRSKSGLHPYRAALFFILREQNCWPGPKTGNAITAASIGKVATHVTVRMLAEMFDKTSREVARDLIDTYRAMEDGQLQP